MEGPKKWYTDKREIGEAIEAHIGTISATVRAALRQRCPQRLCWRWRSSSDSRCFRRRSSLILESSVSWKDASYCGDVVGVVLTVSSR